MPKLKQLGDQQAGVRQRKAEDTLAENTGRPNGRPKSPGEVEAEAKASCGKETIRRRPGNLRSYSGEAIDAGILEILPSESGETLRICAWVETETL